MLRVHYPESTLRAAAQGATKVAMAAGVELKITSKEKYFSQPEDFVWIACLKHGWGCG